MGEDELGRFSDTVYSSSVQQPTRRPNVKNKMYVSSSAIIAINIAYCTPGSMVKPMDSYQLGSVPAKTYKSYLWRQEGYPARITPVLQKSTALFVGTTQPSNCNTNDVKVIIFAFKVIFSNLTKSCLSSEQKTLRKINTLWLCKFYGTLKFLWSMYMYISTEECFHITYLT